MSEIGSLAGEGAADTALPSVAPGDVLQIQYTSGTTGFPKGAMLTHRGLTNNARLYGERVRLAPGEVYLNPMPMFHTAGCSMGGAGLGAGAGRTRARLRLRSGPGARARRVGARDVLLGVPTMLIALTEHPDLARRDLSALRCVVSGGATVPADLVHRIEERLGVTFTIVYGTTECCPLITQTRLDDVLADRAGTLGQPMPQTEVVIADPVTGEAVARARWGNCAPAATW